LPSRCPPRPVRAGGGSTRAGVLLPRSGEFQRRVAGGDFAEWEEIYGDLYGTLHEEVEKALRDGRHLLFDVDVKGALSLKRRYPGALLIFIAPPDRATLEARLRGRHTETNGRSAPALSGCRWSSPPPDRSTTGW